MIEHYQPYLFPFLSSKSSQPNVFTKRYYYWSWEDGLWDLLKKKNIEKGSTILVPDFYCTDVVNNIRAHGYTVAFYALDQQFQIKKQALVNSVKRSHPSVVVIFHACGITNPLVKKRSFVHAMTKKALLLEDCVHQVLDPQSVKPVNDRHFFMDSLRKVTPLSGSFLYGTKRGMQFSQTKRLWTWYTVQTTLLYMFFRMMLIVAHFFHKPSLAVFAHTNVLKRHDDIIGDTLAHRGLWVVAWVAQWIQYETISRMKREQVKWYEKYLHVLYGKSSPFYRISIKRREYGNLHVYPIGLKKKMDERLLTYLKQKNIIVWPKFADSKWAKKRDVLFLPLGFHMDKGNIKRITKALVAWKNKSWIGEVEHNKAMSPHLLVRAAEMLLSF